MEIKVKFTSDTQNATQVTPKNPNSISYGPITPENLLNNTSSAMYKANSNIIGLLQHHIYLHNYLPYATPHYLFTLKKKEDLTTFINLWNVLANSIVRAYFSVTFLSFSNFSNLDLCLYERSEKNDNSLKKNCKADFHLSWLFFSRFGSEKKSQASTGTLWAILSLCHRFANASGIQKS